MVMVPVSGVVYVVLFTFWGWLFFWMAHREIRRQQKYVRDAVAEVQVLQTRKKELCESHAKVEGDLRGVVAGLKVELAAEHYRLVAARQDLEAASTAKAETLATLAAKYKEFEALNADAYALKVKYEAELEQAAGEVRSYKAGIEKAAEELRSAHAQVGRLRQDVAAWSATQADHLRTHAERQAKVDELTEDLDLAGIRDRNRVLALADRDATIKRQDEELTTRRAEVDMLKAGLANAGDRFDDQVIRLKEELTARAQDITNLDDVIRRQCEKLTKDAIQIGNLSADCKCYEERIGQKDEEISRLCADLLRRDAEWAGLKKSSVSPEELAKLRRQLEEHQVTLEKVLGEKDVLQEQVKTLNLTVGHVKGQRDRERGAVKEMSSLYNQSLKVRAEDARVLGDKIKALEARVQALSGVIAKSVVAGYAGSNPGCAYRSLDVGVGCEIPSEEKLRFLKANHPNACD